MKPVKTLPPHGNAPGSSDRSDGLALCVGYFT